MKRSLFTQENGWTLFSLVTAGLFHLLLLITIHAPNSFLGPADSLPASGCYVFGMYGCFSVLNAILLYFGVFRGLIPALLLNTLCLIPFYIINISTEWGAGLAGITVAVFHSIFIFDNLDNYISRRSIGRFRQHSLSFSHSVSAKAACACAILPAVVSVIVTGHGKIQSILGLSIAWVLAGVCVVTTLVYEWKTHRPTIKKGPYAEHILLLTALLLLFVPSYRLLSLPLIAVRQIIAGGRIWFLDQGGKRIWNFLTNRPGQLLVYSFVLVIFVGSVLLALPISSKSGQALPFIDALFTAVSATCVTGLIVVDTGTFFSEFGLTIIISLIQIGGLGIMTISTFFALLLGRNIGLRGEFAVREMIGVQKSRTALRLLKFIVVSTFVIEAVGALFFAAEFHRLGYDWHKALQHGAFHSISAFCNAGFALYSDSLVGFAENPAIILNASVLIILGGLGFGILYALVTFNRKMLFSTHGAIVLSSYFVLIFGGMLLIWLFEINSSFHDYSPGQSALHAFFQSVTTRTAGFNSIDYSNLSPATVLFMIGMMFIGAAPGGTGGGVKVTTMVILAAVVWSVLNGHRSVIIRKSRISKTTVYNAVALIALGLTACMSFMLLLFVSQQNLSMRDLAFEAVSAFGTVGLSLGITAKLDIIGKCCIILLMFMGRVGPLTLLVMMRPGRRPAVRYPEANVMIG